METPKITSYGPSLEPANEFVEQKGEILSRMNTFESYQDWGTVIIIVLIGLIIGNIVYQSLKTYKEISSQNSRFWLIVRRIIICLALCIVVFFASLVPLIVCGMSGQCSSITNIIVLSGPLLGYFLIAFIPIGKKTWF